MTIREESEGVERRALVPVQPKHAGTATHIVCPPAPHNRIASMYSQMKSHALCPQASP